MARRSSPFSQQEEYVSNYEAEPTLERFHLSNAFIRGVRGPWGCLPGHTEFLSERGWVEIKDWMRADRVAGWNPGTGSVLFAAPIRYIDVPATEWVTIRSSSSTLKLVMSEDHWMPMDVRQRQTFTRKVLSADDIASLDGQRSFICTYDFPSRDKPNSDAMVRYAVAVNADGHLCGDSKKAVEFGFHKIRKVDRLLELLRALGLAYTHHQYPTRKSSTGWYHHIRVKDSPYRAKSFTGDFWWLMGGPELKVVAEELVHWDGTRKGATGYEKTLTVFTTTRLEDIGFIQHAANASGYRSTVTIEQKGDYKPQHVVCLIDPKSPKHRLGVRRGSTESTREPSKAGERKFCFEMPTGFFLIRQNGQIFVSKNSGKSVGCVEDMLMKAHQQSPDRYKRRRTRWAAIRNTFGMLRTTTMRTWDDWVPERIAPVNRGEPMSARLLVDVPDGTTVDMEIWFISCDKPADVSKLRGLELTGAWLNEASELDKSILDTVSARVGRFPPKKDEVPLTWAGILMDTNSMDDDHWWYKLAEGVDDAEEQEEYDQLTRKLREALAAIGMDRPLFEFFDQPPALIERSGSYIPNPEAENVRHQQLGFAYWLMLCAGKSKDWIDTFILNKYGKVIDGKPVYSPTEYDDAVHGRKLDLTPYSGKTIYVGIDFGLSPAIVPGQISPAGRLTIFGELCAKERSMGMRRFMNDAVKPYLAQRFGTVDRNGDPWKYKFVGDPSGNDRADSDESTGYQMVRDAGFEIEPAPTNNFTARRDAVAWFLTKRDGFAMDKSCVMLRKGFRAGYHYRRIQVSGEARFGVEPYDNKYTHCHDATQYLALPFVAIEVPAAGYKALPKWMQKVQAQGQASRPYMKRGGRIAA